MDWVRDKKVKGCSPRDPVPLVEQGRANGKWPGLP